MHKLYYVPVFRRNAVYCTRGFMLVFFRKDNWLQDDNLKVETLQTILLKFDDSLIL